MKFVLPCLALVASLFSAAPSHAMTVGTYDSTKKSLTAENKRLLDAYFIGAMDAHMWARTIQVKNGGKPHFCPPGKMPISGDTLKSVVDAYIATHRREGRQPAIDDIEMGLAMMLALVETFPCDGQAGAK